MEYVIGYQSSKFILYQKSPSVLVGYIQAFKVFSNELRNLWDCSDIL